MRSSCCPRRRSGGPRERTLLVADAHFGKAVSFRALGVPVPRGTTSETLAVLGAAGRALAGAAHRLPGRLPAFGAVARRRDAGRACRLARRHRGLHLTLVRGNHDDRAGDPPASLGFEVVDEPLGRRPAWRCATTRGRTTGRYVLAGHLHPCVSLGGRARDRLRLACFHFGDAGRRAAGVRRLHRHASDRAARRRPRLRRRRRRRRGAAGLRPRRRRGRRPRRHGPRRRMPLPTPPTLPPCRHPPPSTTCCAAARRCSPASKRCCRIRCWRPTGTPRSPSATASAAARG